MIDQFDYLMQQNLDHLHTILDACNLSPFKSRGADFTRVRESFLDDLQKSARQTILLSAFSCPEANAVLSRWSLNVRGAVKTALLYQGAIAQVLQHSWDCTTHMVLQHSWDCNTHGTTTLLVLQHPWYCNTPGTATHMVLQDTCYCNTHGTATASHMVLQHRYCNTCTCVTRFTGCRTRTRWR
jgi:hypothetical protein